LKLQHDEPLSIFAFSFNVRYYNKWWDIIEEKREHEAGAYTRPLFSST
jgi:hypothetical protein